jgi:hypothetical protein
LRPRNQADRILLKERIYHQRGETILTQGVLPFKYEKEKQQGLDIQTHKSDPIFIDSFTGARDGAIAMLDRPSIEISFYFRMVAGNP